MSVRRPSPSGDAPPLLALSQAPRRLDEVLRASKERGVLATAAATTDESGLTRALKKASLAPTGTCLPRTFDPDYCAYDRYYAIGVTLVSGALGALVSTEAFDGFVRQIGSALEEKLGRLCHVPQEEAAAPYFGSATPNPLAKPYHKMTKHEKVDARGEFGIECQAISRLLTTSFGSVDPGQTQWGRYIMLLGYDVQYSKQELIDRPLLAVDVHARGEIIFSATVCEIRFASP